jgi:hypothetical protein
MEIITIILNIIRPIIQIFVNIGGQEYENWYNQGDEYPELEEMDSLEEANICEDTQTIKQFNKPVFGEIIVTSKYGYRTVNIDGIKKRKFHRGVDIRAYPKTEAIIIEDCKITEIVKTKSGAESRFKWDEKKNTWIDLKNGAITPRICYKGKITGRTYKHKHVKPNSVIKTGMDCKPGELMGTHGNYGYSRGSHLHLEIWENGKHKNPIPILKKYGFKIKYKRGLNA